jgi:hypothetical protein
LEKWKKARRKDARKGRNYVKTWKKCEKRPGGAINFGMLEGGGGVTVYRRIM